MNGVSTILSGKFKWNSKYFFIFHASLYFILPKLEKKKRNRQSNFSKYLLPVQDIYIYKRKRKGKVGRGFETSRLKVSGIIMRPGI